MGGKLRERLWIFSIAILALGVFLPAQAAEKDKIHDDDSMHHHDHSAMGEHEHSVVQSTGDYEKLFAEYSIPALELTDQFEHKHRLDQLLAQDRPILVQFIFTSCTTICPIMGAVFGGAQADISAISKDYLMVSISIDPEYDTPARLREFAEKQSAHDNWTLLTGTYEDIQKVIKAFDVLYQGDNKMYHQPYTFIRWSPHDQWTRLRGLMSVAELTHEFQLAENND